MRTSAATGLSDLCVTTSPRSEWPWASARGASAKDEGVDHVQSGLGERAKAREAEAEKVSADAVRNGESEEAFTSAMGAASLGTRSLPVERAALGNLAVLQREGSLPDTRWRVVDAGVSGDRFRTVELSVAPIGEFGVADTCLHSRLAPLALKVGGLSGESCGLGFVEGIPSVVAEDAGRSEREKNQHAAATAVGVVTHSALFLAQAVAALLLHARSGAR